LEGYVGDGMVRTVMVTENELVSEWLIRTRWMNALNITTRLQVPGFVDDAVWAAVTIVAGTSNGKVNVSPKLVLKALMLNPITAQEVKRCEIGYDMSDRQARRLAQTARFALEGIKHRIQEYEHNLPKEVKMSWKLEKGFVNDYYSNTPSILYSKPLCPLPTEISALHEEKKYVEYAYALRAFRLDQNGVTHRFKTVGVYKEI